MRHTRRALSLAEILVALTALIPVLLILATSFPMAYEFNGRASDRLEAQEVVREHLEGLRATEFDKLSSYTKKQQRGPLDLTVEVAITEEPAAQNPVLQKKAVVTATWPGNKRPLTVSTLLYRWAP